MTSSLSTVSYLGATILFVLCLGGLSNPETSRRGNVYGIVGMAIAVLATVFGPHVTPAGFPYILGAMVVGAAIGLYAARIVKMTQMPELVALMHSLVGLAAMLVGYANFVDPAVSVGHDARRADDPRARDVSRRADRSRDLLGLGDRVRQIVGANQWQAGAACRDGTGSTWPASLGVIYYGYVFIHAHSVADAMTPMIVMTVIALLFGVHMVMAIGGADMPVVVSMLNSYSGWAAAATGFMLSNDLLIVVGALVGSSGAILSYIMCRAMNRNFLSVIAGGFGTDSGAAAKPAGGAQPAGEVQPITAAGDRGAPARGEERDHRSGLRHGRRAGAAHGLRDHEDAARKRRQRPVRHPSGRRPHARPHERAAGGGEGPLRHRLRDGRAQRGLSRTPTSRW